MKVKVRQEGSPKPKLREGRQAPHALDIRCLRVSGPPTQTTRCTSHQQYAPVDNHHRLTAIILPRTVLVPVSALHCTVLYLPSFQPSSLPPSTSASTSISIVTDPSNVTQQPSSFSKILHIDIQSRLRNLGEENLRLHTDNDLQRCRSGRFVSTGTENPTTH